MLVIIRLNISIAGGFLHCCSVQLDIAHTELFRRHKVVFILLVVAGNFLLGNRLLRGQCVNVNRRFTHDTLLCNQCSQFVRFTLQHEVGPGNAVDQLLRGELVTQCLSVLIGGHAHLIHNCVVAVVIKFAVNLESRCGENSLLNLIVANVELKLTGVLIQQRFVHKTIQHLLTQRFHITFVRRQLRILIAQLLLHAVTFAVERILELPAADLLAIHFSGVVIAPANQVTTHAGQNERHDNDTENNLEHETVSSRA